MQLGAEQTEREMRRDLGMPPEAYNRIFLADGRYMDLIAAYPPNIEAVAAVFPSAKTIDGVLFTYGSKLYNPHQKVIPIWVLAHERRHTDIQGEQVAEWWDQYLVDGKFRFEQELLAHQDEYALMKKVVRNPEHRAAHTRFIARRLSSPLYGEMVSYGEALKLIRKK